MVYPRSCAVACLLFLLLTACQPIRPVDALPPAAQSLPQTTGTQTGPPAAPSLPDRAQPTTSPCDVGDDLATDPTNLAALDLALEANWQVGEIRAYSILRTQSESEGNDVSPTIMTITPVTVTVLAADADGYRLAWSYGATEFTEESAQPADPLTALLATPELLRIEYATDAIGSYGELLNREEIVEVVEGMLSRMFQTLEEDDLPTDIIDATRAMMDEMIADPARFDALIAGDVHLFHALLGYIFTGAEPITFEDVTGNLLGGTPIPSEITIVPTGYDPDAGCLQVTWRSEVDPIQARNSVLEILQEQAARMGVPGPSASDLPRRLELIDTLIYQVDVESGWLESLEVERLVTLGPNGRRETLTLTRTPGGE